MAARLVRSRLLPHHVKRSERRSVSVSAASLKEPVSSSDVTFSDQSPSPPLPTPSSGAPAGLSWGFLKFGSLAAITATIGAASYASYAYTLDEVEQKANTFREKAKVSSRDDASSFQNYNNLVYSMAMRASVLAEQKYSSAFDDALEREESLRQLPQIPLKIIELYLDLRKAIEDQVQGFTEPSSEKLLPDLHPQEQHAFTLVLDLNETLVYSDWKRDRGWRTFKRPGIDAFLEHLAKFYEVVVYSDQLSMYVDPVIERLDQKGCIRYRLSRAATKYVNGKHYRDLSKLNRDPSRIMYISGHALEFSLQPENCVPIKPWKLENDDTALLDLIPFLEYVALHRPADIRPVLASYQGHDIASEFIERSKEHQKRMREQKQHSRLWRR